MCFSVQNRSAGFISAFFRDLSCVLHAYVLVSIFRWRCFGAGFANLIYMKYFKLKLWLLLSLLGIAGVASLLLSTLPLENLPQHIRDSVPPQQLKLLILINPVFFVLVATAIGAAVYDKVGLTVPVLEKWLGKTSHVNLKRITGWGIVLGVLSGILLVAISQLFKPHLPSALVKATDSTDLNIATKLLYGGITEEVLMRFGLMSLFCWLLFKIIKKHTAVLYWTGILLASVLFALGHLPIASLMGGDPTPAVYAYIILGNSVGGIVFGYAYWKYGLESAFIAHAFAHLTMIALGLAIG